jgi:hypothetical protein
MFKREREIERGGDDDDDLLFWVGAGERERVSLGVSPFFAPVMFLLPHTPLLLCPMYAGSVELRAGRYDQNLCTHTQYMREYICDACMST